MRCRIEVDKDLCQGHGMCRAEAPTVFDVSDQGQLYDTVLVLREVVAGGELTAAQSAAAACPNRVITLVTIQE